RNDSTEVRLSVEGGDGGRLARRWMSRLEGWIARAAEAKSEEAGAARPASDVTEASASMNVNSSENRACARCGRSLRWALPLCWGCDDAVKKAGAVGPKIDESR